MPKKPSYRQKKVGKYLYGVVAIDGKEIYLGEYGTDDSLSKYQRLISEWAVANSSGNSKTDDISVTEICIDYVTEMKKQYGESDEFQTVKRVLRDVRRFYGPASANDFKSRPGSKDSPNPRT